MHSWREEILLHSGVNTEVQTWSYITYPGVKWLKRGGGLHWRNIGYLHFHKKKCFNHVRAWHPVRFQISTFLIFVAGHFPTVVVDQHCHLLIRMCSHIRLPTKKAATQTSLPQIGGQSWSAKTKIWPVPVFFQFFCTMSQNLSLNDILDHFQKKNQKNISISSSYNLTYRANVQLRQFASKNFYRASNMVFLTSSDQRV